MNLQVNIFNTLSGKEEVLKAIDPNHLKIYVCGPTVYDRPHIGNARSIVIYDLFFRFFQQIFPQVTYVRNITDVDDKINDAAKKQGISIQDLTKKITKHFYDDVTALKVLRPTFEPRATEHISDMITMIESLIANGHAYENQGHVLFDVSSYKDYGKLSNRHIDELVAGARIEIADYKEDPLDFVLWKPADKDDDISAVFESPWGKGRPGWHIECSAMSFKYLGADFDIHGGGADLQFPHHENEIAQSVCSHPNSHYARFWVHNGFLTVNGEKMSKSLKNFITVRELLDKNISGIVIRYLLLSSHYRKPLDFNDKALSDAKLAIDKFYSVLSKDLISEGLKTEVPQVVLEFLADDLNLAKVMAFLHEITKEIKANDNNNLKYQLIKTLDFLGFLDVDYFDKKGSDKEITAQIDESEILSQIELRLKSKAEKNFAKADEIRNNLLQQGIILEDKPGNITVWKAK